MTSPPLCLYLFAHMDSPTWLMFFYQLPAQPSTQRVYVWRKLKTCGAVYLQRSVCVLPSRPELRATLDALCEEIETRKGEARISAVQMTDARERDELFAKFRAQSDEEYDEFLGQCRDFHAELAKERKANHFTFAELDENEAELEKLKGWLPKIEGRDFFGGALKTKAAKAMKAAAKDLDDYAHEVAAHNLEKDDEKPGAPAARASGGKTKRKTVR